MTHSFTGKLEKWDGNLWGYFIFIPTEIAEDFIKNHGKRIRCNLNGKVEYPCAILSVKGQWFVNTNKQARSKAGLVIGEPIQVTLTADQSEFGFEMPEELEVLLEQDEEGKYFFDQLTKGKQRSLVYIVFKVKNPNSRMNKALAIVHHLKEVEGKLDYKLLNETIKMYNQRGKLMQQ